MKLNEIREVGTRGVLFTFEFGDSVYLIKGEKKLFLCDTSEGIEAMQHVLHYIEGNRLSEKELILFNSHSDWDHIWGNDCFPNQEIIAHETCYLRMKEKAAYDAFIRQSSIQLKFPTITFQDCLDYPEEGVRFEYAPSHTICSSICIDLIDQLIYVGDVLEEPIPSLNHWDLESYLETLNHLEELGMPFYITGHSQIVGESCLLKAKQYIQDVMTGKYLVFSDEYTPVRHAWNMKHVMILRHEYEMKQLLKEQFIYSDYKNHLWETMMEFHPELIYKRKWDFRDLSIKDLELVLQKYNGGIPWINKKS